MSRRKATELPADLVRAQKRFTRWRRAQRSRTRLPEALWAEAVSLAREYGRSRTARALGLDYYGLRKRLEAPLPPVAAEQRPGFVELFATAGVEYSVEMERGDGVTIRICVKGGAGPDLAALSREFLGGLA